MTSAQELQDRLDVADVVAHYSHCLDRREVDRIVDEVFAHDAIVDYGYGEWHGAEVAAWISRQFRRYVATAHLLTNVRVTVDGDTATSSCYLLGLHWLEAPEGTPPERPADLTFTGVYEDTLRREPAGWRIARRRFRPLGPSTIAFGTLPDFFRPG